MKQRTKHEEVQPLVGRGPEVMPKRRFRDPFLLRCNYLEVAKL